MFILVCVSVIRVTRGGRASEIKDHTDFYAVHRPRRWFHCCAFYFDGRRLRSKWLQLENAMGERVPANKWHALGFINGVTNTERLIMPVGCGLGVSASAIVHKTWKRGQKAAADARSHQPINSCLSVSLAVQYFVSLAGRLYIY